MVIVLTLNTNTTDDYTSLAIPAPAYDWDFRQVATTGVNNNIMEALYNI